MCQRERERERGSDVSTVREREREGGREGDSYEFVSERLRK